MYHVREQMQSSCDEFIPPPLGFHNLSWTLETRVMVEYPNK